MSKPEYRIENWQMGSVEDLDPYRAPETYVLRLFGNIQGHPNCTPGKDHMTSAVKNIDLPNRRVETRNSIYHLGKIKAEYYEDAIKISKPETVKVLQEVYYPEIGQS